jgi:Amt family ammonium transporter
MLGLLSAASVDDSIFAARVAEASGIDVLWMVIATSLVMFMQGGFLLLEAGSVRSKNTINVAQKNATDLIVSGCIFMTLGATIMFGAGSTGWFGFGDFSFSDTKHQPMLIYQFGFCAAAATIVSGAIAERMRFHAYIFLTAIIAAIVYPAFGHLVWGNALIDNNPAFLADLGFLDFAGGSVVHVIGGAAALGACLAVGPRIGRFDENGKVVSMPGHSSVLSLFGVVLLGIAWVGFNAGTASPSTPAFTQIVVNTVVAMCFGGLAGLVYDMLRGSKSTHPKTTSTGILGGLVGITAGCAYVDFQGAMVIGFASGMVATIGAKCLLHSFKIDDPVDAIATHLIGGATGTLMIPLFVSAEFLTMSRIDLLVTQATGVGLALLWGCGAAFAALKVFSLFGAVRVSPEEEEIGLNLVEHNENIDLEPLKRIIAETKINLDVSSPASTVSPIVLASEGSPFAEQQSPLVELMVDKTVEAREEFEEGKRRFTDYEKVDTDWLWEADPDFKFTYVSDRFLVGFGASADELLGTNYLDLLEPFDRSVESLKRHIDLLSDFADEIFACTDKSGQRRIFSIAGIAQFNARGEFTGYRGRSLEITDKVQAQNEIQYLAFHDHLTGLANRKLFENQVAELQKHVAEHHQKLAVIALDLDGFKPVNDNFGHHVGDELLRAVAKRLQSISGPDAIVSRFGGDEFVIAAILPEDGKALLADVANWLISEVRRPYHIEGLEINISSSLGSAVFPDDAKEITELVQLSDIALYEAKGKTKGTWMRFSSKMKAKLHRRKRLEDDIRKALRDGGIYAVYQPQIDLNTQKLTGFEALARWAHPEFGDMAPSEFVRIAEETGVIDELGQLMLREACKTAVTWPQISGQDLMISVNVSPYQFYNEDIFSTVKSAIEQSGLDARRLEIEITEGTLVRESDQAIKILRSLREIGVRIAVDDFGTGYSSLSYLQRFPLDRLKIDRAFVRELEDNVGDQRITHAIIDLGRNLGLNVIAEGVETAGQLDTLSKMSCHEAQGFLISRPVGAVQTLTIIAEHAMGGGTIITDQESHDEYDSVVEREGTVNSDTVKLKRSRLAQ